MSLPSSSLFAFAAKVDRDATLLNSKLYAIGNDPHRHPRQWSLLYQGWSDYRQGTKVGSRGLR